MLKTLKTPIPFSKASKISKSEKFDYTKDVGSKKSIEDLPDKIKSKVYQF